MGRGQLVQHSTFEEDNGSDDIKHVALTFFLAGSPVETFASSSLF